MTTGDQWLHDAGSRALVGVSAGDENVTERPTTAVVCGTAGGVGCSVVSLLLAAHGLTADTVWIDCTGADSDIADRWRGEKPEQWTPAAPLPEVLQACADRSTVIDMGTHALAVAEVLAATPEVVPVLVVSARPDLVNRSRTVFQRWRDLGVLARTAVVIDCQIPTLNHRAVSDLLAAAVSGRVRTVIGLDYDPHLGEGTAITGDALMASTTQFIAELADAVGGRTASGVAVSQ